MNNNYEILDSESNLAEISRTFFANVYKYMFIALAVSGLLAYYSAKTGWYIKIAFTETGMSPMGYIIVFAPVGLAIWMQTRFMKMSVGAITGLTAWEMQRLKQISANTSLTSEERKKLELIGGLKLYILFINLFLSILRFVGKK